MALRDYKQIFISSVKIVVPIKYAWYAEGVVRLKAFRVYFRPSSV